MMRLPVNPAIELQRMNTAATPDALRVSDQPRKSRIGDRKIPPPVPVRPDRKPIPMPHGTPAHIGGSRGSRFDLSAARPHQSDTTEQQNATDQRPIVTPRQLNCAAKQGKRDRT